MTDYRCDLLEACPVGDLRDEVSTLRTQLAEAQAVLEAERTARERDKAEAKAVTGRLISELEKADKAREQAERGISLYRAKRAVDGLNGRNWDAQEHLSAERQIDIWESEVL